MVSSFLPRQRDNVNQWSSAKEMDMRFGPTINWRRSSIFAGIAIVASGAALLSGIIPAARSCAQSTEATATAPSNDQRLQETLDIARRPGTDFRLDLGQRHRPHDVAEIRPNAVSGTPAEGLTDPAETTTRALTAKLDWIVICPAA
jgi:hypothetical protein